MKYQSVLEHPHETDGDVVKKPGDTKSLIKGYNPALESLYFRSFGSRPLLDKNSEIELAKKIDEASRTIRLIIKQSLKLTHGLKKGSEKEEAVALLKETLDLSGLSDEEVYNGTMKSFNEETGYSCGA